MQRKAKQIDSTFIGGLNTEASEIAFPKNFSFDETNFELLRSGKRRRRKGIDFEDASVGYTAETGTFLAGSGLASMERDWLNAGGYGTADFTVVQTGRFLSFWGKDAPFSAQLHGTSINLMTYAVDTATASDVEQGHVEAAYGNGRLYVVGEYIRPFYVEYDIDTDDFETTRIDLSERDFTDLEDLFSFANMPTDGTITDAHTYNLKNSGWTDDLIEAVRVGRGNYPALSEIPYKGYLPDPTTGVDTFDWEHLTAQLFGDSRAPRGHFIRSVWDTTTANDAGDAAYPENAITDITYSGSDSWVITTANNHGFAAPNVFKTLGTEVLWTQTSGPIEPRSTTFDGSDITVVAAPTPTTLEVTVALEPGGGPWTESYPMLGKIAAGGAIIDNPNGYTVDKRPRAVGFYTGRVWYAGTPDVHTGTTVYYSQIIESPIQAQRAYQAADPTSEHISDIVATDGGTIKIPELGNVLRMEQMWDSMLIFADNGVWQIRGGEDRFFSPTSYRVRRISNVSFISPESLVITGGAPILWAADGIYALAPNENGAISDKSITEELIQSLYQAIPDVCKARASGSYDTVDRRICWTYSDDESLPEIHNKILWYDLRIGAFSIWDIPVDEEAVIGVSSTQSHEEDENRLRFLVAHKDTPEFTRVKWAEFSNTSWEDWATGDSTTVDAAAFLETGNDAFGDPSIDKQQRLVHTYMERTDTDSSCRFSTIWDWAIDGSEGNKTREVEIYKDSITRNNNNRIVSARNKVRGKGRVLRMRFETTAQKDCVIVGWASLVSAERVS